MGTPAVLAFSRKSPKGAVILEQTCFGSSQRAFRSRTNMAVVLLSRVTGFASGRFGPSCAEIAETNSVGNNIAKANLKIIFPSPCSGVLKARSYTNHLSKLKVVLCGDQVRDVRNPSMARLTSSGFSAKGKCPAF